MDEREKILDKIQKLLAMATSPNELEAASFAAKAQEFMLKHRISLKEVEGASVGTDGGFERLNVPMGVNKWRPFHWCMSIMLAVADTFQCKVLYNAPGRTFTVIGTSTNAAVVQEIYHWLFRQVHRLSLEHLRIMKTGSMKVKNNFLRGCANRVAARMRTEYSKLVEVHPEAKALITQDMTRIEEFITASYPNLKKGTQSKKISDWTSFSAGQSAGDRVRLKKEK